MHIAFIDHSYHMKTASSQFFRALLEEAGNSIDLYWCEAWRGGSEVDTVALAAQGYDLYVFWQLLYKVEKLHVLGQGNVLLVPMYDSYADMPHSRWEQYRGFRFLSFSRALDRKLRANGLVHLSVQYWPAAQVSEEPKPLDDHDALALYWERSPGVGWRTIRRLARSLPIRALHVHENSNSGRSSRWLRSHTNTPYQVTSSEWSSSGHAYRAALESCNVYFAPRKLEGIGMSFLEAMAMGKCVIAPNRPTMNEYIHHGVNGYLYNPVHPRLRRLMAQEVLSAGNEARISALDGLRKWQKDRAQIMEFIGRDTREGSPARLSHLWSGPSELSAVRKRVEDIASYVIISSRFLLNVLKRMQTREKCMAEDHAR